MCKGLASLSRQHAASTENGGMARRWSRCRVRSLSRGRFLPKAMKGGVGLRHEVPNDGRGRRATRQPQSLACPEGEKLGAVLLRRRRAKRTGERVLCRIPEIDGVSQRF